MSGLSICYAPEMAFTPGAHIYHHLNYLFRTDRSQKWTNDLTELCLSWPIEDESVRPAEMFGGIENRTRLHDGTLALLKEHLGTDDLAAADACSHLFMARIVPVYGDDTPWHPYMGSPVGPIAAAFERCERASLLCAVCHVDQTEEPDHIHILFDWCGRKPRGEARIFKVFEEGGL